MVWKLNTTRLTQIDDKLWKQLLIQKLENRKNQISLIVNLKSQTGDFMDGYYQRHFELITDIGFLEIILHISPEICSFYYNPDNHRGAYDGCYGIDGECAFVTWQTGKQVAYQGQEPTN